VAGNVTTGRLDCWNVLVDVGAATSFCSCCGGHTCSPMAEIGVSAPQPEHLIEGSMLGGRSAVAIVRVERLRGKSRGSVQAGGPINTGGSWIRWRLCDFLMRAVDSKTNDAAAPGV
jgi:hypothetical protein